MESDTEKHDGYNAYRLVSYSIFPFICPIDERLGNEGCAFDGTVVVFFERPEWSSDVEPSWKVTFNRLCVFMWYKWSKMLRFFAFTHLVHKFVSHKREIRWSESSERKCVNSSIYLLQGCFDENYPWLFCLTSFLICQLRRKCQPAGFLN